MDEFFPPVVLFDGTIFAIDRIMLIRIVVTIALVVLFMLLLRKPKLVPSRAQSIAEMGLDFVRKGIAYDMLGKKLGDKYFPLLATLFMGIFFLNITSVIPFFNISSNARIGMPLVCALVAYVTMIVAGVSAQGGGKYLKSQLFPAGVPKPMYVLVTPIEFISTFIARPLSLTLRLMFNMIVGHLLLVLCFSATQYLVFTAGGALAAFGAITFVGGFVFTLFEILVAVLQAYVFTLLTAAYIQLSVSEDH